MKVVCIGDSITAGQLLPAGAKAWPAYLPGEVLVAGVPGDTTRLGLERFPRDVQVHAPDVTVIQFGHNDANRWLTDHGLTRVSLAAYGANLEEMIDRCVTFGSRPILCTITHTARSFQHAVDCEIYNAALVRLALRRDVALADVRAAVSPDLLIDGLHLGEDGHRAYAAVVAALLP